MPAVTLSAEALITFQHTLQQKLPQKAGSALLVALVNHSNKGNMSRWLCKAVKHGTGLELSLLLQSACNLLLVHLVLTLFNDSSILLSQTCSQASSFRLHSYAIRSDLCTPSSQCST